MKSKGLLSIGEKYYKMQKKCHAITFQVTFKMLLILSKPQIYFDYKVCPD